MEIIFAVWLIYILLDADHRPRKSLITWAILGFLVIIGLADLLGVSPVKSFWSNFERMEGYISLLHLGMFFFVASSIFKEVDWKKWWNTTLIASAIMIAYSFLQVVGVLSPSRGDARVDGTFGNAIYLAVYMLFHIFIATLMLWRGRKSLALRWTYGVLIVAQLTILYYTATRGAILGLLGGLAVMACLNLFNRDNRLAKKLSLAFLVGLAVLIGGFFATKNTAIVQNSPVLSRFASLSFMEIKSQGRYFVWPIAFKGFKDRPLLGWGQENFSYVFQKYSTPDMFALEPWFDRVHDIFLDWMISGGLLGLISYLSLYIALFLLVWGKNFDLSHEERSIITGLVAAYFFHNIFVFDHLTSYVLFFSLLAYVHSRSIVVNSSSNKKNTLNTNIYHVATPAVAIVFILVFYFVNFKPISGNVFLIEALKSIQTPGQISGAILNFEKAYGSARLGRPEVAEFIDTHTSSILSSDISPEEKNAFFIFAKEAIVRQTQELEDDARYELLAGSFLSTTGQLDEALVHLQRAKELMPSKQQIYFEIGAVYINQSKPDLALKIFKEAYEMAPDFPDAGVVYLVGAIYANDRALEDKLLSELPKKVSDDPRVASAYKALGR